MGKKSHGIHGVQSVAYKRLLSFWSPSVSEQNKSKDVIMKQLTDGFYKL